ncbi:hypothetical protein ACFLXB_09930, partial [Chloroflexota bacterium]
NLDNKTPELITWAETIMRFLEINLSTLKAKCKKKFGSVRSGIPTLLEMTAFLMDCHFAWKDLRYLNIVLKLMDLNWLYSFDGSIKLKPSQKDSMQINHLQSRLMIMRQAALKNIDDGLPDA